MNGLITFTDIKALFFRKKWLVLGGALLLTTIGVWKRGQLPLEYEIAATFKDSRSNQAAGAKFDTFLKTLGAYQEKSRGQAFFISSLILEPTVVKLGLQAKVSQTSVWDQFCDAWRVELGKRVKKREPLRFENVHYTRDKTKRYEIFFTSRESFEIRDTKDHFICAGSVGEEIFFEGTSLTLVRVPGDLALRTPYPLTFSPLLQVIETIRSNLEVEPVGQDDAILGLELIYPEYEMGKKIVNTMMATYEAYLATENERISDAQVAYLEKKRDRFCAQREEELKRHATYLKEKGGLALKAELPFLQKQKEDYLGKLRALELERLGTAFQNRKELHHLTKERDALTLSLAEVESSAPLLPIKKKPFEGNIRLTSLQEEIEKKRLTYGGVRGEEYRGIDLPGARKLLLTYLEERDSHLSKIKQLTFAKKELEGEEAEYISLAAAFPDPTSQTLVKEMGTLTQQLRKKRSLTENERKRIEKRLALKKEDFLKHIDQTLTLTRLEKERAEERITSVQRALLDLLGQEISLIEQQVEDQTEEKLAHLEGEKKLIEKELAQVDKKLQTVPDTWVKEQQLEFSAEMNRGMLEALVQLALSKSIENNLKVVESKPLDYAYASPLPKAPLLKLFGGVGALLGALITFALCMLYHFHKGFPLTLHNLALRGKKVLGSLDKQELETLRHLSLLIEKKLPAAVALILGKEEDYAPSLAKLLTKEGKKVLVIGLHASQKNVPGLIHFLEGEAKAPTIEKKPFGDLIVLGGNTSYINEALKGEKFATFLKELKETYDVILLPLQADLTSALPQTFFAHADLMVLNLEGASERELAPYFTWEKEGHSLAFLG
ncbi:hypothetical protein [Candidatus Neptunochlamydia vexilliferae]|uniref:Polysaccharide chain length determinant N-terminal domain-containing protein n=1 Tax=Candidatus Neptunichlamydia vexilliferae TaxID=1651774 RepID=A0ABS0AX82_9BACT|nr:hypothetical protein [Candidatus Neptunochlamydia vexilliferae]MBF5058745.1 hypothetical protein [Candidatus Neptunochlamydia vexilliferae]